jgi:hypothetical protein
VCSGHRRINTGSECRRSARELEQLVGLALAGTGQLQEQLQVQVQLQQRAHCHLQQYRKTAASGLAELHRNWQVRLRAQLQVCF